MNRPGLPPYVGSCRECGVVNGHSISCRVDLIVEGITRGLRREGYVLIEASHHAELVSERDALAKRVRDLGADCDTQDTDGVVARVNRRIDLLEQGDPRAATWVADFREILAERQSLSDRIDVLEGASIGEVWRQAEENHRTYSDTGDLEGDIRFLTLGLTGEAGEVANFVKKRWRDGDGHDEAIKLEIADVCAYAFMLANTMGMTPNDLIQTIAGKQQVFIEKMTVRAALHQEHGSGE